MSVRIQPWLYNSICIYIFLGSCIKMDLDLWLLHSKWENMGTDLLWHSTNTSWIYPKCTLLCSLYNTNNGSDNIHFNGKQMLCFSDSYWREKPRFLLILLTLLFPCFSWDTLIHYSLCFFERRCKYGLKYTETVSSFFPVWSDALKQDVMGQKTVIEFVQRLIESSLD